MIYFIITVVAAVVAFGFILHQKRDRQYDMYASFARDWKKSIARVIASKQKLADMDVPVDDEEAHRFRNRILAQYDEDLLRLQGYVEHWVSMVPERLRKRYNCP